MKTQAPPPLRLVASNDGLDDALRHADEVSTLCRRSRRRDDNTPENFHRDRTQLSLPLADQVEMFLHCERYQGRAK